MVIGSVEAGGIAIMIVDISVIEAAIALYDSNFVIGTKVFETELGSSTAVSLTDNSLVVEDGIGNSVGVTITD